MATDSKSSQSNNITISPGDTLSNLAHKWFDDYSQWREIANIAGIDIFSELPIGNTLGKPTKEEAEKKYKKIIQDTANDLTNEVNETVQEILTSREAQTIAKLIGVDTSSLTEQLDLSNLTEQVLQNLTLSGVSDEAWTIIQWIL